MTVRRLKAVQRGPICSYCTARAAWRGCYFTRFACDTHLDQLKAADRRQAERDAHQSDAEWSMGL